MVEGEHCEVATAKRAPSEQDCRSEYKERLKWDLKVPDDARVAHRSEPAGGRPTLRKLGETAGRALGAQSEESHQMPTEAKRKNVGLLKTHMDHRGYATQKSSSLNGAAE